MSGTHDVGRIVHRDHVFPVVGPTFHVLRMRGLHVLDLAELALVIELLDEKVFPAVHDRFGHHVLQSGFADQPDDLPGLVKVRRHRHRAHDVLARLQRCDCLGSMIGNRAVDVDEINVRIGQNLAKIGVASGDAEPIADFVQPALRSLADRRDLGFRVRPIDRNELRTKTKPDESCARFFHDASLIRLWREYWGNPRI